MYRCSNNLCGDLLQTRPQEWQYQWFKLNLNHHHSWHRPPQPRLVTTLSLFNSVCGVGSCCLALFRCGYFCSRALDLLPTARLSVVVDWQFSNLKVNCAAVQAGYKRCIVVGVFVPVWLVYSGATPPLLPAVVVWPSCIANMTARLKGTTGRDNRHSVLCTPHLTNDSLSIYWRNRLPSISIQSRRRKRDW